MRIAVLGSGSWGSALSIHFGRSGFEVIQWCREKEVAEEINEKGENRTYLPGFTYPEGVRATGSVLEALEGADVVFSVIPAQYSYPFWRENRELLKNKKLVCSSKGIDVERLKTLSELYKDLFKSIENYYVLSGPTFAKEVAEGLPAAAVLSNESPERALEMVRNLSTPNFRLYASGDVKGVELGGALKNVIAIATGISDGMGFGNNARAALITRGLHEIKRLGRKLGAREETFYGLSGLGDLVLTCTGDLSRNRQFGISLSRGEKRKGNFVVEGVYTVKAVHSLARELSVEMPISEGVYKIIYEGVEPKKVIEELLSRPVKEENR
ncbi:MAG: NAD(P)-dependent glycerol-3-phosphate dehydrogenase [Thermovibrio sp.]|nr:MAG: NAD(P)-dependent glycerol-3-phosphate dehydrogenase [Thermovibrio sp.]